MSGVEPTDTAVARPKPLSIEVVLASTLFGLLGAGFLSIYYADRFHFGWAKMGGEFPWSLPAWSYGVTVFKMAGLILWLVLSRRPCRWPVGILAGIFLVGGLHALACGYANHEFQSEGWWIASHVQLAYASGVTYLVNFVLVVRRVIAGKARPWPGFLLGLLIGAGLPAAAEFLLHRPW